MKRNTWHRISLLLLSTLCLAAGSAGPDVTPPEREQALRYLTETRKGVVEAVKGLSEAQWKFKPGPNRWSVAEVVEHLAFIENFTVQNVFGQFGKAPAPTPDRDPKQIDAVILAKVPDRSTKFQAPEPAVPTGRWTPADALEHFLTSRTQIFGILESTRDLRGHVIDHPALGPLDGYQWILAVAAHCDRHTKQILEVKADPRFPAN